MKNDHDPGTLLANIPLGFGDLFYRSIGRETHTESEDEWKYSSDSLDSCESSIANSKAGDIWSIQRSHQSSLSATCSRTWTSGYSREFGIAGIYRDGDDERPGRHQP